MDADRTMKEKKSVKSVLIRVPRTWLRQELHYEIVDDPEPYYGEISECKGVWATGETLEECRRNLEEALEGWIVVRLQRGLPIPP